MTPNPYRHAHGLTWDEGYAAGVAARRHQLDNLRDQFRLALCLSDGEAIDACCLLLDAVSAYATSLGEEWAKDIAADDTVKDRILDRYFATLRAARADAFDGDWRGEAPS